MAPSKKVPKVNSTNKLKKIVSPLPVTTPGGPIDIVFSFDTTTSMDGCIAEVRNQVQKIITRLFTDIPNLRVAVFAHGDYDTADYSYVTKYVDFTNDCYKLCNFVENVKTTAGGRTWPECYELVLKQVREELSWQAGSQRSLVMIGDSYPHEPSDSCNKDNIDWREETDRLINELGVHIYGVQCTHHSWSDPFLTSSFYETLAKKTHGKHLELNQFATIVDIIMGICYREHGAEFYTAYEEEIREREGKAIRAELDRMLVTLRDPEKPVSDVGTSPGISAAAVVVTPSDSPKTKKSVITGGVTKRALKRKANSSSTAVTIVKKARKDGTKIFPREKEISSYFAMNKLSWSPWKPILTSSKPKTGKWSKTRKHYCSFRNKEAFSKTSSGPAIWEFAVQDKRNIPVFCKVTDSYNPARKSCDAHLLKHPNIRNQTEGVVTNGCRILARRASFGKGAKFNETVVNSTKELRKLIKDTYDYAWSSNNTTGRYVQKNSVCISKDLSG